MPAGSTYSTIATQTLGSSASSVTFSSIPSTYTDLVLISNASMTSGQFAYLYFNSDTGSNYSRTELIGTGTSAGSFAAANLIPFNFGGTSGQSMNRLNVMNYSNTTTFKTVLWRNDRADDATLAGVGLWRSTSAINTLALTGFSTATFVAGSTFTLYGIAAA